MGDWIQIELFCANATYRYLNKVKEINNAAD
jgi:hypothetical protein